MERELHGVFSTATYHQPQRRDRFTPSKHFPLARRAPHRQWRPPWLMRVHAEQFRQDFEGFHRRAPRLQLVFQPRSRAGAPCSLRIVFRRKIVYLHRGGGRCVLECDLFSFVRESETVPRQEKFGVDLTICVCPPLGSSALKGLRYCKSKPQDVSSVDHTYYYPSPLRKHTPRQPQSNLPFICRHTMHPVYSSSHCQDHAMRRRQFPSRSILWKALMAAEYPLTADC